MEAGDLGSTYDLKGDQLQEYNADQKIFAKNMDLLKKESHGAERVETINMASMELHLLAIFAQKSNDPIKIERFLAEVSKNAVAEGNQRNTIFSSSDNIVQTFNDYKDHPKAMSATLDILRFYGEQFDPNYLKLKVRHISAAGPESFRTAIKDYVIEKRLARGESLDKIKNDSKGIDYTVDSILADKCLFGVTTPESMILTVNKVGVHP